MKYIRIFKDAFHGKGYRGYSSKEGQKKFAESLLKLADKLFWAPVAYLGVTIYQGETLSNGGGLFVATFFVLAVVLRHEALKVYDYHDEDNKKKESRDRVLNRSNSA